MLSIAVWKLGRSINSNRQFNAGRNWQPYFVQIFTFFFYNRLKVELILVSSHHTRVDTNLLQSLALLFNFRTKFMSIIKIPFPLFDLKSLCNFEVSTLCLESNDVRFRLNGTFRAFHRERYAETHIGSKFNKKDFKKKRLKKTYELGKLANS